MSEQIPVPYEVLHGPDEPEQSEQEALVDAIIADNVLSEVCIRAGESVGVGIEHDVSTFCDYEANATVEINIDIDGVESLAGWHRTVLESLQTLAAELEKRLAEGSGK